MLHVSIAAEKITEVFGFPVTNSLLMTAIVSLLIISLSLVVRKKLNVIPGKLQSMMEMMIEFIYNLVEGTAPKHTKEFFPLIMTFFIFILFSNWLGLVPGLNGIGIRKTEAVHADTVERTDDHTDAITAEIEEESGEDLLTISSHSNATYEAEEDSQAAATSDEHSESVDVHTQEGEGEEENEKHPLTPLLRASTADLNTTIALALIAVVATWYYGFKHVGPKVHLSKFFNLKGINSFVGILEFIGEFSKILSFSFRLFGNIFAGEVLMAVMGFLIPVLIPIPFLGLEIFVGLIQALVFSLLTLVFLSMAVEKHH